MYENNSSYLIHSAKGTNWTKKAHKYISRVWKKGKWVYEYPITGKGYMREAHEHVLKRNPITKASLNLGKENGEYMTFEDNYSRPHYEHPVSSDVIRESQRLRNKYKEETELIDKSLNDYYTKSLIGKGKKWLEKIFNN